MKTYRRHGCEAAHRTFNKLARCMIPRAVWVTGEGPFALIAWCCVPSVSLWPTLEAAEKSMGYINDGCGGNCTRRHEIVRLVPPAGSGLSSVDPGRDPVELAPPSHRRPAPAPVPDTTTTPEQSALIARILHRATT